MFKWDLAVGNSDALEVERRRTAEAARKSRIFNARSRIIGLDLPALERQVVERREREEEESRRDKAFDLLRLQQDVTLIQQQKQEEDGRMELSQELLQFQTTQQRAEDSRDADLRFNHQGAPEISISVPESQLGPASMQIFQGEDVGEKERNRAQTKECERVLRAQGEEKERLRQQQRLMELLRDREQLKQDRRAMQLNTLEEECKRVARIALSNYNCALAAERAEKQRMEKLKAEGEALAEVWHMVTSDLLTERPEAAKIRGETDEGEGAGTRVLPDRWKGMSVEQRSAIHRQRDQQRAEKQRQHEMERQREAAWDCLQKEQSRAGEEEEKMARERERQRRTEMDRDNRQLAREQRVHQEYLDKQLYTNRPTAHYFTQFNNCSR